MYDLQAACCLWQLGFVPHCLCFWSCWPDRNTNPVKKSCHSLEFFAIHSKLCFFDCFWVAVVSVDFSVNSE